MDVVIRACEESDLEPLARHFGDAPSSLHKERFVEQQRGEATYLITWLGSQPVAHLKIRWAGSVHEHVAARFPGVPEIRRFHVLPNRRGEGIGSRLLARAEQLIVERGYKLSGLAVGVENHSARRLYERHGYRDWQLGSFASRWEILDGDQIVGQHEHVVTYMVNLLTE